MRPRHTRRSDPSLAGPTVQRATRLPVALVELVQADIASGIPEVHNLTDAITDAMWLWHYENARLRPKVGVEVRDVVDGEIEAPQDRELVYAHDRPTWSDVDLAALDEPANLDGDG